MFYNKMQHSYFLEFVFNDEECTPLLNVIKKMSQDDSRREEKLTYIIFRDQQTLAPDQVQPDMGVTTNTWILLKGRRAIWLHWLVSRPSQVCAKHAKEGRGSPMCFCMISLHKM